MHGRAQLRLRSSGHDWTAHYVRPTNGSQTAFVGTVSNGGGSRPHHKAWKYMSNASPAANFLRIIGQDDWDVSAAATAITA